MAWTTALTAVKLFYHRLGIFLLANILWILTSLPLITLPAATGALFHLVQAVITEERDLDPRQASLADFWAGFRLHWRRSTLLSLLDLAALFIVVVSMLFYWRSGVELLHYLIGPIFLVLLLLLAMQLYLFPLLLARPELSTRDLFVAAFWEVIAQPRDSFLLLAWIFIIAAICIALGGPVLLVLFSLIAVIQMMNLRIIRIARGEITPVEPKD
ncbi:MAG: DUF624 domain-containing protein [Anaerolineales bacterium]|nr:DUF624 domain-containing protein [Anaerolineales bacterium]MCB0013818.1 DUF624 domain-containing protein [Anaerolineales bacterium]MCB0019949.1 DUF624 domain-containing protein [Anaerolineales bacterium]MCB0029677.1 DUF624 domain-containing protein [Anaerolineales bacterium]MCB8962556.1 DUF624 domain-containing protein [Ardenticatenales bacterium]